MCIKRTIIFFLLVFSCLLLKAQYSSYELGTLEFVAKGESSITSTSDIAIAQNELAIRYYQGTRGASKDIDKAIYWFTESANNGNRYAQYNLANKYLYGEGVSMDKAKALYWFVKSGEQHYHEASLQAGLMYYNGVGTSVNYTKAAEFSKDAAFGGIGVGMYNYALCLAYGNGVKADSTKALIWLFRAIDKNYYKSYNFLGVMYRDGIAVNQNNNSALYYFEKGDEYNDPDSQYNLGYAYLNGTFVDKDSVKALDYYIKAANNGSVSTMKLIPYFYIIKGRQFYDLNEGIYWCKKLISLGESDYIKTLISLYYEVKKYDELIELYEKIGLEGDTDALNTLAYFYAQGEITKIDFEKAIAYIDEAIALAPNNMDYQDSKGEILLMRGEKNDIKQAKQIWKYINKTQPSYFENWTKEHNGEETPFYKYMKKKGK